jgi:hypothetical protein
VPGSGWLLWSAIQFGLAQQSGSTPAPTRVPRVEQKRSAESVDSAQVYLFATLSLDYAAFANLRSDRKPARISSERSRGCSHAAK